MGHKKALVKHFFKWVLYIVSQSCSAVTESFTLIHFFLNLVRRYYVIHYFTIFSVFWMDRLKDHSYLWIQSRLMTLL